MLLLTYRVGHPPFGSRSFHTTLALRSLSEAESLAMAGRVLGSEQFPEELQTMPMDKAGVPLFIEELTKTFSISGSCGGKTVATAWSKGSPT